MGIWSAKIFGLWKLPHCDRCQVQLSDSCPGFCPIGFPIKYQFRGKKIPSPFLSLYLFHHLQAESIGTRRAKKPYTHLCLFALALPPSPVFLRFPVTVTPGDVHFPPTFSKRLQARLYIFCCKVKKGGGGVGDASEPWKTLKLQIGVCLYNLQVNEERERGKLSPELQYCVPGNWGDISWTKPYLKKKKKITSEEDRISALHFPVSAQRY